MEANQLVTYANIISIIALISTLVAIIQGITNLRRNKTADDKKDAVEMSRVIFQLETIAKDTTEIKNTIKDLKNEVRDHAVLLTKHDESLKAMWRIVDKLQGKEPSDNE